jgi:dynein heavy chain 2
MIQRKWVYLEPIFIRGALPEQTSRFEKLDTSFRNIMGRIAEAKKVAAIAGFEGLDSSLDTILEEE